jgi:cell division topological specificity factor
MFRRKSSRQSAVERLKLVLIHDRLGVNANSNIISMIKKDILDVISSYVEIDTDNFSVEITKEATSKDTYETKLVANIPIIKVKHSGRDNY